MIKLQYRCLDSNSIANHLICDFDRKICCSPKSIDWGHSFILKEFRTCFELTHSNEKIILYLAYVFQIIAVFFSLFHLFVLFFLLIKSSGRSEYIHKYNITLEVYEFQMIFANVFLFFSHVLNTIHINDCQFNFEKKTIIIHNSWNKMVT